MKDYCVSTPFCWSSNVFLVLGTGLAIFGLFSPFWQPTEQGVSNLMFICDEQGNNCQEIEETGHSVYGIRGLIAVGICFCLLSIITGFFICCCCPDAWDGTNHSMLAIKLTFMLLAGGLVLGGVIWWRFDEWRDCNGCTSRHERSYAYYITCAAAACLLIGAVLTAIGLCCERETEPDEDCRSKDSSIHVVGEHNPTCIT